MRRRAGRHGAMCAETRRLFTQRAGRCGTGRERGGAGRGRGGGGEREGRAPRGGAVRGRGGGGAPRRTGPVGQGGGGRELTQTALAHSAFRETRQQTQVISCAANRRQESAADWPHLHDAQKTYIESPARTALHPVRTALHPARTALQRAVPPVRGDRHLAAVNTCFSRRRDVSTTTDVKSIRPASTCANSPSDYQRANK